MALRDPVGMAGQTSPPTGTVTFLFTDIEGSTELWDRDRRAMGAAVARHDELTRTVMDRRGGYVFTTAGDSFAVAFGRAVDAVGAAVELQVALGSELAAGPVPVRVRMGLHSGECEERDGDYFGPAVTRAARVMGLACGGQALVSRAVEELAAEELGSQVGFRPLGEYALRGLSRPEAIYELTGSGLRDDLPAPARSDERPGNLPSPPSTFVGRVEEIAQVGAELGASRAVTLVGPGGVGKTRLSIESAAGVADEFPDGVWFIELAPVSDTEAVVHTLAATLSVRPEEGSPLLLTVAKVLAQRRVLVVLDNCEHVIDSAAAVVSTLLSGTESVSVLASSREALEVPGERVWPVGPMDAAAEASELFIDRARAANPTFDLTAADRIALTELCADLDGIPLAVELAAARCRSMTVSELAARLDDRFRVLKGSRRSGNDPRQQTLQATVDWSYQLLESDEQALFDRLAVFAGTFDIGAAEAVCTDEDLDEVDIADLLDTLVARSMVQVDQSGGETRFRLLETLRQFGRAKLEERSETPLWQVSHLAYYLTVASEAWTAYQSSDYEPGRRRFESEWDNLRAALDHAEATGRDGDANAIVRDTFWYAMYGVVNEHRTWANRRTDPGRHPTAEVIAIAGWWAVTVRDYDLAGELGQRAVAAAPTPEHPTAALGWVSVFWAEQYSGGDLDAAQAADRAAKEAAEGSDDPYLLSAVLCLPYAAIAQDPMTAPAVIDRATRRVAHLRNDVMDANLAIYAGIAHFAAGDPKRALTDWEHAAALADESGTVVGSAMGLALRAIRAPAVGEDEPMQIALRFASVLTHLHQVGMHSFEMWTLAGLAAWWASQEKLELAAHVVGFLDADDPRGNAMVADLRAAATNAVDSEPGATTWRDRGAHMNLDGIVAYSIENLL